MWSIKLIVLLV